MFTTVITKLINLNLFSYGLFLKVLLIFVRELEVIDWKWFAKLVNVNGFTLFNKHLTLFLENLLI